MIIAIYLKTESGDGYHFQKEVNTETEMLAEIVLSMDIELAYVHDYKIIAIGGDEDYMRKILSDQIILLQETLEDV